MDSVAALSTSTASVTAVGYHERWQKPQLRTSFETVELLPPHPTRAYTSSDLLLHRSLLKEGLAGVNSPFDFQLLLRLLNSNHFPNMQFAHGVINSLILGHSSNFRDTTFSQTSVEYTNTPEILYALQQSQIKEIEANRLIELPESLLKTFPFSTISPQFGVSQKEKIRPIIDFKKSGVNARIDTSMFGALVMDRIPLLLESIRTFPHGTALLIGTEDVTKHFRNFPTAPVDRVRFLIRSFHKHGTLLLDQFLAFGNKAAPFLCSHLLNLVVWLLRKMGVKAWHYMDNFYFLCCESEGKSTQDTVQTLLSNLGIPLNPKDSSLSPCAELLGFSIDAVSRTISISTKKRTDIASAISETLDSPTVSRKVLEKINGKLVWLSQIISGGLSHAVTIWSFLDADLSPDLCLPIPVTNSLNWFLSNLLQWSGISFFDPTHVLKGDLGLSLQDSTASFHIVASSDSSPIGGSFLTSTHFTWWGWCPHCWKSCKGNIAIFEFASMLIGLSSLLGSTLRGSIFEWRTDSLTCVQSIINGYSRNAILNALLQELLMFENVYQFRLQPKWVSRSSIALTDSFTRIPELTALADGRIFVSPLATTSTHAVSKDIFGITAFHL
jgi:hypothetical protein